MQLMVNDMPILLASEPVDFRKSIDGLCQFVTDDLPCHPGKGIFIFYNQSRNRLKLLCWPYLMAYCDYGEVEIDNNWVENQIRPFALGRKNWLFIGNQRGADAAALFYSLIQTCKLNDVPPGPYLSYLLSKAEAMRKGTIDLKSLLPQFIDRSQLNLGA